MKRSCKQKEVSDTLPPSVWLFIHRSSFWLSQQAAEASFQRLQQKQKRSWCVAKEREEEKIRGTLVSFCKEKREERMSQSTAASWVCVLHAGGERWKNNETHRGRKNWEDLSRIEQLLDRKRRWWGAGSARPIGQMSQLTWLSLEKVGCCRLDSARKGAKDKKDGVYEKYKKSYRQLEL